jgi:hypothetical protein
MEGAALAASFFFCFRESSFSPAAWICDDIHFPDLERCLKFLRPGKLFLSGAGFCGIEGAGLGVAGA